LKKFAAVGNRIRPSLLIVTTKESENFFVKAKLAIGSKIGVTVSNSIVSTQLEEAIASFCEAYDYSSLKDQAAFLTALRGVRLVSCSGLFRVAARVAKQLAEAAVRAIRPIADACLGVYRVLNHRAYHYFNRRE